MFRLIGFVLLLIGSISSVSAQSSALPAHVIERFGELPVVPDGPLEQALIDAIEVAFVAPLQANGWGAGSDDCSG